MNGALSIISDYYFSSFLIPAHSLSLKEPHPFSLSLWLWTFFPVRSSSRAKEKKETNNKTKKMTSQSTRKISTHTTNKNKATRNNKPWGRRWGLSCNFPFLYEWPLYSEIELLELLFLLLLRLPSPSPPAIHLKPLNYNAAIATADAIYNWRGLARSLGTTT